jgi:hypothetical protein
MVIYVYLFLNYICCCINLSRVVGLDVIVRSWDGTGRYPQNSVWWEHSVAQQIGGSGGIDINRNGMPQLSGTINLWPRLG